MSPLRSQTGFRLKAALAILLPLFGAIAPTARLWLPEPVTCGMACCEASGVCSCQHHHTGVSETAGAAARAAADAAKLTAAVISRSCPAQCAQLPAGFQKHSIANQRFAETSAVPGTQINVSGQRNINNGFVIDGLSANDDAADLPGTFFSQEVIGEFQVITSGGIAEFGRASAGIVNVVTKSGTNDSSSREAIAEAFNLFNRANFQLPN